jgi:hypothetical protein
MTFENKTRFVRSCLKLLSIVVWPGTYKNSWKNFEMMEVVMLYGYFSGIVSCRSGTCLERGIRSYLKPEERMPEFVEFWEIQFFK